MAFIPTRALSALFTALFIGICSLTTLPAAWAAAEDTQQNQSEITNPTTPLISGISVIAPDSTLDAMGAELHSVYESSTKNYTKTESTVAYAALLKRASAIATQADGLLAKIKPYNTIYQNFLNILGKAPEKGDTSESPSVTAQRKALSAKQRDISERMTRLRLYQLEAQQLVDELRQHGSAIQQATLTQRFPTPLGITFWSQLVDAAGNNTGRLSRLAQESGAVLSASLKGQRALLTLGSFALSALLLTGWLFSRRGIRSLVSRVLPAGRIRAIVATVTCSILTAIIWRFSFDIAWAGISFNNNALQEDLSVLAGMIAIQIPICGFVTELGFNLLSRDEKWRIISLSDTLAKNLRLFPFWFAVALAIRGILRFIDTKSGLSSMSIQFCDALYVLSVSPLLFAVPRQLRLSTGEGKEIHSSLAPLLQTLASSVSIVCWIAVFLGYIPLAYSIITWISGMAVTTTALVLFAMLVIALGDTIFPSSAPVGSRLVQLGLPARLVDQACVVIPGIICVFLVIMGFAVATAGATFDPSQIFSRIAYIFNGADTSTSGEGGFHISLDAIILCILLFILGSYAIKILTTWFRERYFPKTSLDIGAQSSILSIITYSSWILIGLTAASTLGVTMKSMTWVVSALSVGIGFGLQSIVQNFVSGIILMAERPVSIGDVVEIAGSRGVITRISVRSTNIALSDKSTLIVPNSQFITTAVRNATRSEKPGVFTTVLQLPFASDLERAMQVMIEALAASKNVDPTYPPTATITNIADGSALLTGTARANDVSSTTTIRSEALFDIWQAFQENNIPISIPNSLAPFPDK